MQALMLAAGMGKRLGKYTENATKCMVPVNGKTLIEYAIEALIDAGIKKFVMVVGYKKEVLKNFLDGKYPQIQIEFIDNDVFESTNNIFSLYMARDILASDDTILLESDLIYDKKIIKELVENPAPNMCVVSPFEAWMDGTVTVLNHKNEINGILGKADFDWSNKNKYYKTVNIYKFSADFSKNIYMPFLNAYQTAYGKNEYYETVLKVISFLDGTSLKAHIVDGSRWYEIDDPADLAIAETRFSSGKRHLNLMQKTYGGYWRYPSMLDFCYLVNPYFPPANLINELTSNFSSLLADYPSGDKQMSLLAGKIFGIPAENIAVGNGAAELISALSQIDGGKLVVPFPTFNEYPERWSENNCTWIESPLDSKNDFSSFLIPDSTLLMINPENPSGKYYTLDEISSLAKKLAANNQKMILDESFVDFADKDVRFTFLNEKLLEENPNVIVIKSISKSYGVPGLRLGVIASSDKSLIQKIQKKTSIWNINSFGEYFLQIFDKYKKSYWSACDKIAEERAVFIKELKSFKGFTVYPSQANYVLVKLVCDITAENLAIKLLDDFNIFIKDLSSKKGFEKGQFIRLAVRNREDDFKLISALKEIL